jgi:hypothetical protein
LKKKDRLREHLSKEHPGNKVAETQLAEMSPKKVVKKPGKPEDEFECPEVGCGEKFASVAEVKRHQADIHGKWGCDFKDCEWEGMNSEALIQHKEVCLDISFRTG